MGGASVGPAPTPQRQNSTLPSEGAQVRVPFLLLGQATLRRLGAGTRRGGAETQGFLETRLSDERGVDVLKCA
jgi:hypothetical protein